jgi:hypothetical protein
METENETIEVEPLTFITTIPEIRIGLDAGNRRSNWQLVSSQGWLSQKLQWRWYGRLSSSNIKPKGPRQWRKPG